MKEPTFWYYQSAKDNQWYWRLRANNNQIIAQGEGYTTKQSCINAIGLVKSAVSNAPVKESTATS